MSVSHETNYVRLYHGSFVPVALPEIRTSGFYKDFGFGFYCTNLRRQAERWAREKRKGHVVSVYQYIPDETLSIKSFSEMTEEWLDMIAAAELESRIITTSLKSRWQTILFGTTWKIFSTGISVVQPSGSLPNSVIQRIRLFFAQAMLCRR